ncbi:hypothetical protein niasHT_034419 [Heterodera trifolii]|uniref:Uncharacterized protein n=1 Tax=Heterodera trifolii TaxID=157864 RepID=A0ABD2HQ13_9BILA
MLEDSLKSNAGEQLIDELVSADVLGPLVDCLSKDHASRPPLVANAMAALAIIAPQKAKEIYSANYKVVGYLKDWIKNTKDEELLKNAISILKNLLANDCAPYMDYREFSNLFDSRNKQVVEEAMWAAYHLIS